MAKNTVTRKEMALPYAYIPEPSLKPMLPLSKDRSNDKCVPLSRWLLIFGTLPGSMPGSQI